MAYLEDRRLTWAPCGAYGECYTLSDDEGSESHFECGCEEQLDADGKVVRRWHHDTRPAHAAP